MKIVFLNQNFYAIGGVEEATVGLAQALAGMGHKVQMVSVKQNGFRVFPENVEALRFYLEGDKSIKGRIKLALHKSKAWYKDLLIDTYIRDYLEPYGMYRLRDFLNKTDADLVVSTRESFHYLLHNTQNPKIKNKFYFFHIRPDSTKTAVPILDKLLKKIVLENALFITAALRENFRDNLAYENYKNYAIIGNTISERGIIERDKILASGKKQVYTGCILTRFSPGKEIDMENIISAGKYLKENAGGRVIINCYGSGSLKKSFFQRIIDEDLQNILIAHKYSPISWGLPGSHYRLTNWEAIANNDFVIDLSAEQGFGMIYIEAILQGKPVFATRNTGSEEVLKGMSNYIFDNHKQMLEEILDIENITSGELQKRYDVILSKYGPQAVAKRFLDVLNPE